MCSVHSRSREHLYPLSRDRGQEIRETSYKDIPSIFLNPLIQLSVKSPLLMPISQQLTGLLQICQLWHTLAIVRYLQDKD